VLPPGPRWPAAVQTLGWWTRPVAFVEGARARYGSRFTVRLLAERPLVLLSDPAEVKALFTAPADVLHPGEGARLLEPLVGRRSLILLDEGDHLGQRRLMLPAFHGEHIQRLAGVMAEVAEREVASWPHDERRPMHPRLQALTLEVILRAVFGLDSGERLDAIRSRLIELLSLASRASTILPPVQRSLGGRTPWARFVAVREETDALLFELIDERRRAGEPGDDVLALLLAARDEASSPMTPAELRDQLMTLLVAGHETTASQLAFVFERLAREPEIMSRLVAEVDAGDGDAYLTATVQETMRARPVLATSAPRLVMTPYEIAGVTYPAGVALAASAYLVHHDAAIYGDPYVFRPDRFLDEPPGTYTWIPFGGGRRRCLGASFAMLEMKVVLRAVLAGAELHATGDGAELTRRRAIAWSPGAGARVVLRERAPAAVVPAVGR
jgi:cytochrome P450